MGWLVGGRREESKAEARPHPASFAGEFENTRKPLKDFFFLKKKDMLV